MLQRPELEAGCMTNQTGQKDKEANDSPCVQRQRIRIRAPEIGCKVVPPHVPASGVTSAVQWWEP